MKNEPVASDLAEQRTNNIAATSQDGQRPATIYLIDQAHDLATSAQNAAAELERCKRYSKQRPAPRLRTYVDSLVDKTHDFLVTLDKAFAYPDQEQQGVLDECRRKIVGTQQQLDELLKNIDVTQEPANVAEGDTTGRATSSTNPSSPLSDAGERSNERPAWVRGSPNTFTWRAWRASAATPNGDAEPEETMRLQTCAVCTHDKPADQYCTARYTSQCTHNPNCCIDCLQTWLRSNFEDHNWTHATCPECHSTLSYHETQRLADRVTFTRYDDFLTRQVFGQDDAFQWCMNPRCSSGQVHLDGNPHFACEACGHAHCLRHRIHWHEGQTCEEYDRSDTERRRRRQRQAREDAASEDVVDQISEACPNRRCGARIHKRSGCDHMTCTACGQEFCWMCLVDWSEVLMHGPGAHTKECRYHTNNLVHDALARAEALLAGMRLGGVGGLGMPAALGPEQELNWRGDVLRAFRHTDDVFATVDGRIRAYTEGTGGFEGPARPELAHRARQAAVPRCGGGGPPRIHVGRAESGLGAIGVALRAMEPSMPSRSDPEPRPQDFFEEARPPGNRGVRFPSNFLNATTGHGTRGSGPPAQLRPPSPDTWPGGRREAQRTTARQRSHARCGSREDPRSRAPRPSQRQSTAGRPREHGRRDSSSPRPSQHRRTPGPPISTSGPPTRRSRVALLARELAMGRIIDGPLAAMTEQIGGMTADVLGILDGVVPRGRDNEALSAGRRGERDSESDRSSRAEDGSDGDDGSDWAGEEMGREPVWW